jgi:hypothetical protein
MEKLLDKRNKLNDHNGCNEYNYNKNNYSNYDNGSLTNQENFSCEPITKDSLEKEAKYLEHDYYNTYVGPFTYLKNSPYKY